MTRLRVFNRFLESARGARSTALLWLFLAILVLHAGYREWRDRPLGKPASLLFVAAETRGTDLLVSFALHKARDCAFSSSRWVERIATGERWYLSTAEASSVDPNDETVKHIRFAMPPGLPAGEYAFRTKGTYDCPDGQYESDPSFAPFTIQDPEALNSR